MYTKVCQTVKCYKRGIFPYGQTMLAFLDRISELSDKEWLWQIYKSSITKRVVILIWRIVQGDLALQHPLQKISLMS